MSAFNGRTFLVGGAVQDLLLGRKPKDLDFLMICSYDEMRQKLVDDGATIFLEKPEFNTIRCKHPEFGAADFQCDTDLFENLAARDLNINSWAMMISGELDFSEKTLDEKAFFTPHYHAKMLSREYAKGLIDGNPITFNENALKNDPVRWIRAIRFSIELDKVIGCYQMGEFCCEVSRGNVQWDRERARAEFQKLFKLDTNKVLSELEGLPDLCQHFLADIQLNPTLR